MKSNIQVFKDVECEGVELITPQLRPCMYRENKDCDEVRALLHFIYPKAWTHGAGLTIGSAPAGQATHATAVVELEDGKIVDAHLWQIRMLDSKLEFENVFSFSTKEDAELWLNKKL